MSSPVSPSPRRFLPLALLPWIVSCAPDEPGYPGSEPAKPTASAPAPPDEPAPPAWNGPAPKHVLLITVDTLRPDHLGCYGHERGTSPTIDQLARNGALFTRAFVPRGATWPSLTSLLTGKYPVSHGVRHNGVKPRGNETLLTHRLREAGYKTGAFLANYDQWIISPEMRGMDRMVRGRQANASHDEWDEKVTTAALGWMKKHAGKKCLTWVHFMNPHRPYDPKPETSDLVTAYDGWLRDGLPLTELRQRIASGEVGLDPAVLDAVLDAEYWKWKLDGVRTYRQVIEEDGGTLSFNLLLDLIVLGKIPLTDDDLQYLLSRYDAEILGTDQRIRRLLARVESLGLADDTLVIFAADHGDELYDHHSYLFHGSSIYQGVLEMPLIFHWPGVIEPARHDDVVEIVDILPTLLGTLGIEPPETVQGTSLVPRLQGEPLDAEPLAFAELRHRGTGPTPPIDGVYSVRDDRWKLILNRSGAQPRTPPYTVLPDVSFPIQPEELYDLARDPREQLNLLDADRLADRGSLARAAGADTDLALAEYLAEAGRARQELTTRFDAWLTEHSDDSAEFEEDIPEELREELAALGYVDSASLTDPSSEGAQALLAPLIAALERLATRAEDAGERPGTAAMLLAESATWRNDLDAARDHVRRAIEKATSAERARVEQRAQTLGLD